MSAQEKAVIKAALDLHLARENYAKAYSAEVDQPSGRQWYLRQRTAQRDIVQAEARLDRAVAALRAEMTTSARAAAGEGV